LQKTVQGNALFASYGRSPPAGRQHCATPPAHGKAESSGVRTAEGRTQSRERFPSQQESGPMQSGPAGVWILPSLPFRPRNPRTRGLPFPRRLGTETAPFLLLCWVRFLPLSNSSWIRLSIGRLNLLSSAWNRFLCSPTAPSPPFSTWNWDAEDPEPPQATLRNAAVQYIPAVLPNFFPFRLHRGSGRTKR
jgi:hypothetical protein